MGRFLQPLLLAVSAIISLPNAGYALPTLDQPDDDSIFDRGHVFQDFGLTTYKRQQDKVPLRILSLGASIMSGVGSSTGDGSRKPLRDALRFDGWEVNMVGSLHSGKMKDKDHEAVPGDKINQVRARLKHSLPYKPNIVLINAGTNDAIQNDDPSGAGNRMNNVLNDIWGAEGMGDTCVMLSTILDITEKTGRVNRVIINNRNRSLVTDRANDGKCIYLADMDPPGSGGGWITWDDYDPKETTKVHPNDEGHRKMAYVFYKAINEAAKDSKIVETGSFEASDPVCDKVYGNGIPAGGKTQRGSGEHDGIYLHKAEEKGVILTVESDWDRNQWRFARLFSRGYDDLVGWFELEPGVHAFGVWKNSADGQGKFTRIGDLHPNMYCIPRGLHFIDMNADGLDDIVCIGQEGNLYLSINKGDGNGDKPPTFGFLDKIKENEGYAQDRVRLADIDGDGRGDYGILDDGGNVHFWRNGGVKNKPEFWQKLGLRFPAKGMGDIRGVRFEDINGDGRDDWMWVREDGMTDTWTNSRSCLKGKEGDGLNVAWRQGFRDGYKKNEHWTHFGMMDYQTNDEQNLRGRIHFARIYGTPSAFGNLGRQDYVFLQHETKKKKHVFKMRVWKNIGQGGTKVLADGKKYCNMAGHDDGKEDYEIRDDDPGGFWDPSPGQIWTPPREMHRRDLHLADWDNDGDCDIIYVDPKSGQLEVFINKYPETKKWEFSPLSNAAPSLHCNQEKGIGIHDLAVRFADITGNGRADYLCIEKDGRVTGFVHNDDGSFEDVGQIKFADGRDRANLRWADVNGDGRDDMLWVDKFTGDASVWYNEDRFDNRDQNSGSSFRWRKIDKPVFRGDVAGTCMYYPDLDGNGRADQHSILGTWTNEARTSFNPSCGVTDEEGDDSNSLEDPKLPVMPSDGDGNASDEWRKINCQNEGVTDHTMYGPDRWKQVDADGAWVSVIESWQANITAGRAQKHLANNISNYFNGPQDMFCETFAEEGSGCEDLHLQCNSVNAPAGYFIIHSFENLYAMHDNIWKAVDSAILTNDIGSIASNFGKIPTKSSGVAVSILIDIALTAWGLVMGPAWNKLIGPKFSDGTTASTVKDTTNDIVKNSMTLTKDILNSRAKDQLGVQNGLTEQMKALTQAWKDSVLATQQWLFGETDEDNLQLGNLISDASMFGDNWLLDRQEHAKQVKRAINTFLIPLAWAYSPDVIYPFIASSDVACDKDPGWNDNNQYWIENTAKDNGRYCHNGKSFWLLMGRDKKTQCDNKSGDMWCGKFDSPPGFSDLVDKAFTDISLENVVVGSINTKEANGGKNGGYKINIEAPGKKVLESFLEKGIESPGIWNFPICSMEEVIENYYRWFQNDLDDMANFPCNA
ncbi:hypothetical protein QQX98_002784 [Neonectria punicea]|uniref:SGNH hydrolase-type esterase domain-containing protein n=1 Tax=Neonectria punicea TaxID=979145 RepID=A0ABR1HIH2_9HYPO